VHHSVLPCLLALTSALGACGGGPGGSSGAPAGGAVGAGTDVLTYHYDAMRTGQNLHETVLAPGNVNSATFGLLRLLATDGPVDAAPLLATAVAIGGSSRTVLYVATERDSVYAFDADSGALLQQVSLLGSGETPSDTHSCVQVQPEIGITATPLIDRSMGPDGTLYVVAMSEDRNGNYFQRLHALDLATLVDRLPAVAISANAVGNGPNSAGGMLRFAPGDYKERGALLASGGRIYTAWASHCDYTPYNGWIIAYDEASLAQTAVLNFTANGTQGAIWSVAGLAADAGGSLYAMSGNGSFDPTLDANGFPALSDFGNTVMRLSVSSAGLSVSDYFAAGDTVAESLGDIDLGSGSPLLLPDQVDGGGIVRHLLIGAGKDGNVLLLEREHLGRFSPGTDPAYQVLPNALPGAVYSAFAYFQGSVYIADVGAHLKAFALHQARLGAAPSSQSSATFGYPGASPAISANGSSNAIVWAVASTPGSAAILYAFNPADLSQEYYDSTQAPNGRDAFGTGEKFITPVVADGRVFVGTPAGVAVFGLR
jgi:hypothetical protein